MTVRPKTIRRLLLLAGACGSVAVVVGTVFTARRHEHEVELGDARRSGMSAAASGDVARAIAPLTLYVAARPDDVDAVYALALAEFATETPGHDNLFEARTRLQQVLAREPDHLPAKRELLKIYQRIHVPRELLALADELLAAVPDDVEARRCRATALSDLNRDVDAAAAWAAYLTLAPTDTAAQIQLLLTMKQTGHSPDELVAYARGNVDRWPNDPRFLLPLAMALREAGRDAEAKSLLEDLAAKPQSDAPFVVELAAALDRGRSFDAAERLLARSADALGSSLLSGALVERMWQSGRHAQVIAATEQATNTKSARPDAHVLAMRALSLAAVGRQPDAVALGKTIDALHADEAAVAWSLALALEFASTPPAPSKCVRELRDALNHDPSNGILYAWLGRALRAAGEPEQAVHAFQEAAQRMPSWPTPCVELADALLESGRTAEAAAAAKAGFLRAPTSAGAQLQVARVRFAELNSNASEAEVSELLNRVNALEKAMPAEPSLPAMRVALLASRGRRDEADAAVHSAVGTLPRGVSLQPLYESARRAGLPAAAMVFDRALAENAITPALAIDRALELGAKPSGLAGALTWIASQSATHGNDPVWSLAQARVMQALGDPEAAAAWRALVGANPTNLQIQVAALCEAGTLLTSRAEQAAIVERLKLIAGEDASVYRMARARWLASSDDDAEVRQALTLTAELVGQQSGRVESRLLLARVLQRLDSPTTAIEHLRAAHEQVPADAAVALEYAQALQRAGRASDAVAVLKKQSAYDIDNAATRETFVRTLIDSGAVAQATSLLQRLQIRGVSTAADGLLLAESLEAGGDLAAATDAYAAAAAPSDAPPSTLASAAIFERAQGRLAHAQALMERVKQSTSGDNRVRALARYAVTFGELDAADACYALAVRSAHPGVDLMLEAIDFESGRGNFAAASAYAAIAQQRFPAEPRVTRSTLEIATLRARASGGDSAPALDTLIAAMNSDPTARRETEALRAVRQSQALGKPTAELAARLATLADADPQSLELSRQAIGTALATGQPQFAQSIARRLLAERANRIDAVSLAAHALLELRDLPAARRAAERWHSMAGPDARASDVTLAQIALLDGQPAKALATLEPYRSTIDFNSDGTLPCALADALAQAGRGDEAFALLEPALPTSVAARSTWLHLSAAPSVNDALAVHRLSQLASATPGDATAELVRLAGVHLSRAENGSGSDDAARGLALLGPIEATGRLSGNGRALLAELQRASGAPDLARTTLRDALRLDPENPTVKNSLAYALLSTPDGASEAVRLAGEAMNAAPGEASFGDTLARAYVATGDSVKAEATFKVALRVDSECLDAWLGLADLQSKSGRPAEAQASIARFDAVVAKRANQNTPLHLRDQLRVVRQSVATVGP